MSLYKKSEDVTVSCNIPERYEDSDTLQIYFTADCGKHGTDESIDCFDYTPEELLDILQAHQEAVFAAEDKQEGTFKNFCEQIKELGI